MAIEDTVVRREVILPVGVETAWRVLSDAEELAAWLADEVELELRVGAHGWLRSGDGERCPVTVEEVIEGRRIALRWSAPDGPETLVEMVLDEVPEGTRLVVIELPVCQLEAVGIELEQGSRVITGPEWRASRGPQMVAALA